MIDLRFQRVELEYARLKEEFAAGRITADELERALEKQTIEAGGRFWALGANSGKWYMSDGDTWTEAEPPRVAEPARCLVRLPSHRHRRIPNHSNAARCRVHRLQVRPPLRLPHSGNGFALTSGFSGVASDASPRSSSLAGSRRFSGVSPKEVTTRCGSARPPSVSESSLPRFARWPCCLASRSWCSSGQPSSGRSSDS